MPTLYISYEQHERLKKAMKKAKRKIVYKEVEKAIDFWIEKLKSGST